MARKTDFMAWLYGELKTDRGLAKKADVLVAEMKIEQQLSALREIRGLSQKAAAKLVGATEPYVARLEAGEIKNPGVKTLVKYAMALGGRVTVRITPEVREGANPPPGSLRRVPDRGRDSGGGAKGTDS